MRNILLVILLAIVPPSFARGAQLVSEGVTYFSQTGEYTYHYALDNRAGSDSITEVAIVIIPDAGLYQLPPLQHTSPSGWSFVTAIGGRPGVPPSGTFQQWYNPAGLPPGQYLSGFSLTTNYGPRTATGLNYQLFHVPSGALENGEVVAPQLPPRLPILPVPLFMPTTAFLFALALAAAAWHELRT